MTIQDTNTQKLAIKHFTSLVINLKVHDFQVVRYSLGVKEQKNRNRTINNNGDLKPK